jgi:hypothetical protein
MEEVQKSIKIQFQKLFKVHAAEGELPERPLLTLFTTVSLHDRTMFQNKINIFNLVDTSLSMLSSIRSEH